MYREEKPFKTFGSYAIVAPEIIRSNQKYTVSIALYEAVILCDIRVGITGPSYHATKIVRMLRPAVENVEFDLPTLQSGTYELTAESSGGLTFKTSRKIHYSACAPMVHIQTDKAIYKPGDLVQFRVLFLDGHMKPAQVDEPIQLIINDGAQNRVKQLNHVKLTSGVYTGEFQLSDQPVLGSWNIESNIDGSPILRKSFEVAKYVLPKFDVTIETAKDVALTDGDLKVTVLSKYTYGKAVKGKATVSVRHVHNIGFNQMLKKTISVEGKGHVAFGLTEFLDTSADLSEFTNLRLIISACMEEELTGKKQTTEARVTVHKLPYRIESVESPIIYRPGKPIVFKVAVKNLDNSPVRDTESPIKLFVYLSRFEFGCGRPVAVAGFPNDKKLELETTLNRHGMATFEFMLSENVNYVVKCTFIEASLDLGWLSRDIVDDYKPNGLKVRMITDTPRIGKEVVVEVTPVEIISHCVYTIVGRGNILQSKMFESRAANTTYHIKFTPTFEMMPKVTMFVYCIQDGYLRCETQTIHIKNEFENTLEINGPEQTTPGEKINLYINTDAGSFVGLLGVDQSVMLLKSGNDLDKDTIFAKWSSYYKDSPHMDNSSGKIAGLITISNAKFPEENPPSILFGTSRCMAFGSSNGSPLRYKQAMPYIQSHSATPIQMRKDFKENWIFLNIDNVEKGSHTLAETIPDTITSWVITGFSLNPRTGLALTKAPSRIKTFRPFFLSTNLPYSIKRGEQFSMPVVIFNYTDKQLEAVVTLENAYNEFDFIYPAGDKTKDDVQLNIAANSGETVHFTICPKKIGYITLKVCAISSVAGDAIHKQLKVEPEGVTVYKNYEHYLQLKDSDYTFMDLSKLDIPEDIVDDSEYIEVSVMGDIMGSTIQNLDQLVRQPYGCGEQNMVNFVPNILVLRYLETIKHTIPLVEEKAKRFMEIGYQRELTYKHDDGSYSAFGKSDKAGSTWLTAYVMRSFHQAANYIKIDPKVLNDGLQFLANKQAVDGSFVEDGKLFDFAHQNKVGLTAFVLLAFLENSKLLNRYNSVVEQGVQYLQKAVAETDDLYAASIAVYTLQLRKLDIVNDILRKLEDSLQTNGAHQWWSQTVAKVSAQPCHRKCSQDVEVTAYMLLTLLEKNEPVLPIVKWLLSQRNSNGGFTSTQETVVGLQALIKFAEKSGAGNSDLKIEINSCDDIGRPHLFEVNKGNAMVMQTLRVKNSAREISFNGQGLGSAILQISYRYNILKKDEKPSFMLSTKIEPNPPPAKFLMEVSVEFLPQDTEIDVAESNMVVLEVALPSGYTAESESFDRIKQIDGVKRVETSNGDTNIIVYFDSLKASETQCIPIKAERSHEVAEQKPVPIVIYDYYDSQKRATEFYQI